ncbi:DUF4287 domain-containing protein [Namhaeicola litoreus]|uniref:DUF4287 domain-containing protein n=1 Tax=Namhaeicola litoreus TaxID=1052145 RepID=A0ABW3Y2V9_9FLAO
MDQAAQTMLDNLQKNTGKSLEEWVKMVRVKKFTKHREIMDFLKKEHGFTHGFANLVAHKARNSDADSQAADDLIANQYKGKEHFLSLYRELVQSISAFGEDITIAPKNSYVSLRRKKQFVMLIPATKTRFEIGLNLKNVESDELLKEITKKNAMCSHQIELKPEDKLSGAMVNWLKKAYDQAG